jgi:hypothetical protein
VLLQLILLHQTIQQWVIIHFVANTTGACNTAVGNGALTANTTGGRNVALGFDALENNTTASFNTALGAQTLYTNSTGANNTAVGLQALYANTTASDNTAVGYAALVANTTGACNTAIGCGALDANTTGYSNTAVGRHSLGANTEGFENTVVGENAGDTITTGSNLTVLGHNAEPSSATATNEVTLGDTNVTIVRNQGSILFPQSSRGIYLGVTSATASNLLDDYEEGTWTPTIQASGTHYDSVTYTVQQGRYTKVGRLVTAHFRVQISAVTIGSATGNIYVESLPFTCSSADSTSQASYVSYVSDVNFNLSSFGTLNIGLNANQNQDKGSLTRSRNSGVADGLPNSAIGNATDIVGTFIYFVD